MFLSLLTEWETSPGVWRLNSERCSKPRLGTNRGSLHFCYLEHLLVGRVLATLAAEVFAHALELPAEMDHPLDGRLAPAAQLPLGLSGLHLCRAAAGSPRETEKCFFLI